MFTLILSDGTEIKGKKIIFAVIGAEGCSSDVGAGSHDGNITLADMEKLEKYVADAMLAAYKDAKANSLNQSEKGQKMLDLAHEIFYKKIKGGTNDER